MKWEQDAFKFANFLSNLTINCWLLRPRWKMFRVLQFLITGTCHHLAFLDGVGMTSLLNSDRTEEIFFLPVNFGVQPDPGKGPLLGRLRKLVFWR